MMAPGSPRNSQEESYGSNDMAHNNFIDEARKPTQERNRNPKPREMPSARTHHTHNACKPKPKKLLKEVNSRVKDIDFLPISLSLCMRKCLLDLVLCGNPWVEFSTLLVLGTLNLIACTSLILKGKTQSLVAEKTDISETKGLRNSNLMNKNNDVCP
ncbi:hypothetical protein Tco_1116387 [Tanacetum coccineum]